MSDRETIDGTLPPKGSRFATLALFIAFIGISCVLFGADRALVRAAEAAHGGADYIDEPELRVSIWAAGVLSLMALVVGLAHERRLTRRVAERSAELERLSAELIRVNRAKSEFLANVSHELRTPLNAIVGFVDLLQDGVYGELAPRQTGPVARIAASAVHLRQLVDQILDLAKIAAGRLEVHPEPVELNPFIFDVATEVEPLVTERGLRLTLSVPNAIPRLRTDPTHLRQIVINLLGNAVKFTPQGSIAVRAIFVDRDTPSASTRAVARNGRAFAAPAASWLVTHAPTSSRYWAAVQVADTGVGIARGDWERIFDEFEQIGPRAGDSAQRGTGLGLAISRRLARLIGGDLTVDSKLGEGTTFTLWLPVDAADAEAPKPRRAPTAEQDAVSGG